MMRNFVTEEAISDQLFSLPVFLHIGVALLVLLGVWVHLTRLARPLAQPQRRLAASFALALLPALATAPAEFSRVHDPVPVDWLVYGVLPLMHATSPTAALGAVGVLTLLIAVAPWAAPVGPRRSVRRRSSRRRSTRPTAMAAAAVSTTVLTARWSWCGIRTDATAKWRR